MKLIHSKATTTKKLNEKYLNRIKLFRNELLLCMTLESMYLSIKNNTQYSYQGCHFPLK